ncbi:uncharacterized protein AB9X84_006383 isoform 3-T3 [Acanthopagrus schlegelii]
MDEDCFGCQVCLTTFKNISQFMKHVHSGPHQKKMTEVFKKDNFKDHGIVPRIVVMELLAKRHTQPIVGLSLLTFCFSTDTDIFFYLCHLCEEKCPSDKLKHHLNSSEHCSNYFNYMNPNALTFSWIPTMYPNFTLWHELKKEVKQIGPGRLQILDLPKNLLEQLKLSTYSEVMRTLSENENLLKLMEAVKPKRTMIQTYQKDSRRKHPLLGMQHVVECICVGPAEKRYYLCTLCKLTFATHTIIKHVLSFDHIFCYFRAWHPSTLMSKECYKDWDKSLHSMMLGFAKQTEEIHGTANTDMKQVRLEPEKFRSVNFTCYAEALKELESIRKEKKESSLIVSIIPGKKLERCTLSAGSAAGTTSGTEARTTSGSASVSASVSAAATTSGSALGTEARTISGPSARTTSGSASVSGPAGRCTAAGSVAMSAALSYKIRCQDCNETFASILAYYQHVSEGSHKKMVDKYFGRDEKAERYERNEKTLSLGLDAYIKEGLKKNEPVIGVPMVVACLSTQGQLDPIYVCFACEDCFSESSLKLHLESTKHLIYTLLYQNPWRLPFAWEKHLDVKVMQAAAWEEEKQRGPNQMMLKILDMPFSMFWSLQTNYHKVMESLQLHHSLLKREVPRRETFSKLEQNERFPLLGQKFRVMHDVCVKRHQSTPDTEVAFLCLLCERRLSDQECYGHTFSREHVATFLDRFHPGSLTPSTDAKTLLDLAKQAARIHCVSQLQVIKLDRPIWEPCTYEKAVSILGSAKRRIGNGKLAPPIKPHKKLFPRKVFKGHVRGNSNENRQMMQGSVKHTSQNPTNNSEISSTHGVGSGKNAGKGDHKMPSSPNGKESERGTEVFSKTGSEEMKNAGRETNMVVKEEKTEPVVIKEEKMEDPLVIKEEKIEEPIVRKSSIEPEESCQNTDKASGTDSGEEKSKSSKDVLIQVKNEGERKRPSSMFEKSQDDTCSDKDVEKEIGHKRQRLSSKQDASCKEPQNLPSVTMADKRKSGKTSPDNAKDVVPSAVSPQQAAKLWQYVRMTDREPVIGLDVLIECHCNEHEPIYICGCCSLKILERDIICHVTGADHQKMFLIGSKEFSPAAVKHLGKDIRCAAALCEQDNGYGAAEVVDLDEETYDKISRQNFNSAVKTLMSVQSQHFSWPEFTPVSAALPAQPEVQSDRDDYQVMAMEIDDDSEDSVVKPPSVTAAVVPMTGTSSKPPQATPKSKEGGEVNQIKVSESTVSAVTAESTSTISKCPARSTSSTSDTTKSRAPNSSLGATASSCTTTSPTTSTSRKAASKCATSTHTQQTAPKPNSCSTAKVEIASKGSETAFQNPAVAQSTVTHENTGASAKTAPRRNSLGPNADVAPQSNAPVSPHPTVLMSVRSNSKNQHTEPSHTSKSVTSENRSPAVEPAHHSASKTKPGEHLPKVGLNQMIRVTSEGKQQVYCQLCSVKLRFSGSVHFASHNHQFNYLKMKSPEWTSKPGELLSNFNKIVARLDEEERELGSQAMQKIEVKIDEYNKLAALPDKEALDRLEAMLRKRESEASTNAAGVLRLQDASPSQCKVSSPGDETEDRNLAAGQADGTQNLKISETEADDRISDPPPTSHEKKQPDLPNLITTPSVPSAEVAVYIKQEAVEAPAMVDFTTATESPVKMETPQSTVDPPTTDSESGGFAQIPDLGRERSDPELQDAQKTSPANFSETDLHHSAASVNTEQQNQPRASENTDDAPKRSGCNPEPRHHSASQALTRILKGERIQGTSHLSTYLTVEGMKKSEIIGLDSVWECRGISRSPFFLCESCRLRLSHNSICRHMVSRMHQDNHAQRKYPQHTEFRLNDDLTEDCKLVIMKGVIAMISIQERFKKMDARVILLRQDLYEQVLAAPFNEALKMVQDIERELNQSALRPSINILQQNDQQPEAWQSRKESLSKETQPTSSHETDHRCDSEKERQKRNFEETAVAGDLHGVKLRKGSSHVDVTTVSSKADSVVSPPPGAGTCHSLQETSSSSCVQPDPRLSVFRDQRSTPELQVKQEDVHSESPSSSSVGPKTTQSLPVSSRDESFPTRKRLADTSIETLVKPCSSSPQIRDQLPTKRTCSSLQPTIKSASKFTLNPAETSTVLCPKDKDARPISVEQVVSSVEPVQFEDLIALMREVKSEKDVSPCTSGPDNPGTTVSCAGNSFLCESVQSKSMMETNQNRWDSKSLSIENKVTNNPPSSESSKRMFSAAAPVVSTNKSQPIYPTATGSSFVRGAEAKAVGTMMPATADPSPPQLTVTAQFENVSQIQATNIRCVVSNPSPVQTPQPETAKTVDRQLPINAIITPRRDPANKNFSGSYIGQDHAEVNTGHQVAFSLSTVATANPTDALAASGGYGPYSQMPHITNVHVSGFPPYVAGYSIPDSPPVTENLYRHEAYTPNVLYQSQIQPKQQANYFGHLPTPMKQECVTLEMQQLIQQQELNHQRILQLMQQQQQQQQQQQRFSPWRGAVPDVGAGANDAAYSSTVALTPPADGPLTLVDLNNYRLNRMALLQNGNNIITQYYPRVYLSPPAVYPGGLNMN